MSSLQNNHIICFAGEDWWYHNPHSNLHIMKSFAKENRILFVNSIGTRIPDFKKGRVAWKKILLKLRSMLRYCKRAEKNIVVLTPIAIPPISNCESLIEIINTTLLNVQLRIVCAILHFKTPILWVCIPSVQKVALYLKKKLSSPLVYYCVDNISHYSGKFSQYILDAEINLQKNADVAFFVNHQLVEERKQYNPNTYHLGHGVDYEHFAQVQSATLAVPSDIAALKQPIVGCIGSIRDLDFKLVKYLAQKNREVSFVFIGSVDSDISLVKSESNVYFLGKKSYELLPAYMQRMNCFGIFYDASGTFSQYRNPKKLLEYFATGLPVISVSILEVERFREMMNIAGSYDEFDSILKHVLAKDDVAMKRKRIEMARMHTWDDIAEEAGRRISSVSCKTRR